ncbi:MAG: hypothetical protein JSS63_02445 [Bacteroidetes bacterium]|nr:hypothetical protein [Bacteroidota bacterium]
MPITNKPSVTALQVGATAYFVYNNVPQSAKILKTVSEVTDSDNNGTAEEVVFYYLEGYLEPFTSSRLYSSKGSLKTSLESSADSLS